MRPSSAAVAAFLVNAAWQSTAIAALAAVGLRLLRRSPARTRHQVAVVSIALAVLVPLGLDPVLQSARDSVTGGGAWPASAPIATTAPVTSTIELPGGSYVSLIMALYAVLVSARCVQLGCAWWRMRFVRRRTAVVDAGAWRSCFDECCREWSVHGVDLRRSPIVPVPILCGSARPAIVIPGALDDHDPALMRSVLSHEMAHIVRGDVRLNAVVQLLTIPLWFHPAVAWLERVTAREREIACDELVTSHGRVSRFAYATHLLRIAAWRTRMYGTGFSLGFGHGSELETRIRTILEGNRRHPPTRTARVWLAASFSASLLVSPLLALDVAVIDWDGIAGIWYLDATATRPAGSAPFASIVMAIRVRGDALSIDQTRTTASGMTERFVIDARTDDRPFDVRLPNGQLLRARARWEKDRLVLDSALAAGNHRERNKVFLRGGRLIVDTERTERSIVERRQLTFVKKGGA